MYPFFNWLQSYSFVKFSQITPTCFRKKKSKINFPKLPPLVLEKKNQRLMCWYEFNGKYGIPINHENDAV
jgi:hypothetical protein